MEKGPDVYRAHPDAEPLLWEEAAGRSLLLKGDKGQMPGDGCLLFLEGCCVMCHRSHHQITNKVWTNGSVG